MVVLLLHGILPGQQPRILRLRFRSFLELVLQENPQVQIARADFLRAPNGVLRAQAPFDPTLSETAEDTRSLSPTFSQLQGAPTLSTLMAVSSLQYQQQLPWGEMLAVKLNTNRFSSNSIFGLLNPSFGTGLSFSLRQPLWNDYRGVEERAHLRAARDNVIVADQTARAEILRVLEGAAESYWEAVQAQAAVRMEQDALARAQKAWAHDRKEYEIGLIAEGDTLQTASQVSRVRIQMVDTGRQAALTLNTLREYLGLYGPGAEQVKLELLDEPGAPIWPESPASPDAQNPGADAWKQRPEVRAAQQQMQSDQLLRRAAHDALRPHVDLVLEGGSNGLGGIPVEADSATALAQGWSTAFGQAFAMKYPTYGATLQVSLPLHHRAAQADYSDAVIRLHADRQQVDALHQRIAHQIADAWESLRAAREKEQLAGQLVELARQQFDFEQQKYDLGTITAFELVDAQSKLTGAEADRLNAEIALQEAHIAFAFATGSFLSGQHIRLDVQEP